MSEGRIRIDPPFSLWFALPVRVSLCCCLIWIAFGGCVRAQLQAVPVVPSLRGGGDPVSLVQNYEAGKTYRFISENRIRMQLSAQGLREAFVEQQTRIDAMKRPDNRPGVLVRARIERLKVDFRSGEKRVVYDSFKEEDRSSQLGQHFRSSLNRWVDLKLSESLDIVGVDYGGREGVGTLLPGVPQFGLDELEKLVSEIPQGLPDQKVRPGESWQVDGMREITDLGDLNFRVSYRYSGVVSHEGDSCDEVQIRGSLGGDALIPESGGAMAGGRMNFQETSLSGRILFDRNESTVRLKEQSVSMLLNLPSQDTENPFQVPVEQEATIRLLHVVPTP